jgi:lipopolysaccharide biosynthesis glycosyltransferase
MAKAFPIFLASNDTYAPMVAVAIMSMTTHASEQLTFHVLNDNMSHASMAALHRVANRYRVPLHFHGVDLSLFSNCAKGWFDTPITYARYLISDMFPEYDQAMYVDADMVFASDVLDIRRLAPPDAILAACADMGIASFVDETNHKTMLGIPNDHTYFNAGLLLINCRRWRNESVSSALLQIAYDKASVIKCPSQDPLNIYFSPNKYHCLPQRFNHMPGQMKGSTMTRDQPAVIHFTHRKPWEYPGAPYAHIYWKYAMSGPFLLTDARKFLCAKIRATKHAIRRLARRPLTR